LTAEQYTKIVFSADADKGHRTGTYLIWKKTDCCQSSQPTRKFDETYHFDYPQMFREAKPMNISERVEDGISVFVLEGRIDSPGARELDDILLAAVAEGKCKMVLDMAEVSYISSAGLRTLADVVTKNREQSGDLKLVALNRKVLRVMRIIGFDRFFALYDTLEAAVADF
jgi:anti-sigma B factor antagonist